MIEIKRLTADIFSEDMLDNYNRKHEVKKVWRKTDGEYVLVEQPYTEDWDLARKRSVARMIGRPDYITYIAQQDGRVVGFIGLKRTLVGKRMILDMMHVSADLRGQGLGRKLFQMGIQEARQAGAEELYISACSSEETIAFYRAMGAELTDRPIPEIAEDEPFDLQMTYVIRY